MSTNDSYYAKKQKLELDFLEQKYKQELEFQRKKNEQQLEFEQKNNEMKLQIVEMEVEKTRFELSFYKKYCSEEATKD